MQNGPPGTSIVFADGSKVPLPTDQIVLGEDHGGAARVGFGGVTAIAVDGRVVWERGARA